MRGDRKVCAEYKVIAKREKLQTVTIHGSCSDDYAERPEVRAIHVPFLLALQRNSAIHTVRLERPV